MKNICKHNVFLIIHISNTDVSFDIYRWDMYGYQEFKQLRLDESYGRILWPYSLFLA